MDTMQAIIDAFSLPFTDAGKVQCVLLSQPPATGPAPPQVPLAWLPAPLPGHAGVILQRL